MLDQNEVEERLKGWEAK